MVVTDAARKLVVTDAARKLLAERGWDPVYGACALKRTIQRSEQDLLAMMLPEGKFSEGQTVEVDASGGELTFINAKTPVSAPVTCSMSLSRSRRCRRPAQ